MRARPRRVVQAAPLEKPLGEGSGAATPRAALDHVSGVASSDALTRDQALAQAPAALRETVELFLFKTGRERVAPNELEALQRLDEAHTPAVVQKAITRAVERLRRRGEDPARLTLDYVWQSLKHFTTRKAREAVTRRDPTSQPPYPTGVTRLW